MPLPNTNPALNPALQEGLHPDDIARMEIRQKKTNEMIANLNDRLADISSFGQSFQQGIYSSFGNNFITRAAVGVPQMMGDILDSLLLTDEDKKKKKDPIGSALDDILHELNVIDEHLMKSFGNTIKDAFDESFSKMGKSQGDSSDCCEKSLDVLNKILDTINRAFGEKEKREDPIVEIKDKNEIVSYKEFRASEMPQPSKMDSVDQPTEVFRVNPNRIGYSVPEKQVKGELASRVTKDSFIDVETKPNKNETNSIIDKKQIVSTEPNKNIIDVETKPVANRAIDAMLGTTGDKPINVNIVGAAIDRLNEMDRDMEKMVSIIPLSTAEQELESKKQSTEKTPTREIRDVSNKKEIKEEKKEESNKESEPKKESSILGSVMDALGGIAETYGLAKGAKAVLGAGGTLLSKIPKGLIGTAAAVTAEANVIDYGLGKFGVGKDASGNDIQIDDAKDDSNWNKMSFGEKAESGLYRGIEKVGSFIGLDNMIREAKSDRIKNESDYFAKKENINFSPDPSLDKASYFERKTNEADVAKSGKDVTDTSTQNTSVIIMLKTITFTQVDKVLKIPNHRTIVTWIQLFTSKVGDNTKSVL